MATQSLINQLNRDFDMNFPFLQREVLLKEPSLDQQVSRTWGLVRNTDSWAPPRSAKSDIRKQSWCSVFQQALWVTLIHAVIGGPLSQSKLLIRSEINPLPQDTRHSPTSCLEYLRKETFLPTEILLFIYGLTFHIFRELFLYSSSQKNVDLKSVCCTRLIIIKIIFAFFKF